LFAYRMLQVHRFIVTKKVWKDFIINVSPQARRAAGFV